jgi:hypothetical protein
MVRDRILRISQGTDVAKDKKTKKGKTAKKGVAASASATATRAAGKAARGAKSISRNPLVADVIAAALVSTAAALKDSRKARQLASDAGDELQKLSKKGAERGNAMWQLALDIGQRAMDSILGDEKPAKRAAGRKAATSRRTATARKAAAPRKTATAKNAAAPRKAATAPKRTSRPAGRTARKPARPKAN